MAAKPRAVFIIGIVAVAVAAFAAIALLNYLKGQEAKLKETVATERIVVAAGDVPAGATIQNEQVKMVNWPRASLPQGGFSSPEQVTGRMALDRYTPGDPIIEAKLVPRGGQPGLLTYRIPKGHRAMTVGVDQVSGVAGFITPGNMVDVVLTIASISKIVLQDVPILATGQIIEQQKDGKPVVVPTVTMDVTPEDAEKLAVASTQGRLQLVLRRAGDTAVAKTGGATVTKVMGAASSAVPAKPKPKQKQMPKEEGISVEIWRGPGKLVETFNREGK
ncbi:MAG TPA: Flp pilus assembly protein CpaB [Thermodesulfovibrionales bacterium]|nr:Flp pilus assembly protein CpaB [Thermodesulfovibrionales bacterium]